MTSVPSFDVISAHARKRLLPVFTVLSSMLVLVIFASVTSMTDPIPTFDPSLPNLYFLQHKYLAFLWSSLQSKVILQR